MLEHMAWHLAFNYVSMYVCEHEANLFTIDVWSQEDMGIQGETLVFYRYAFQLGVLTIINEVVQSNIILLKYTILMKFMV